MAKCTTGQQWSDEKQDCLGEPVKLDFEEITLALDILNQEIEGPWRLPNRKELESLVVKTVMEQKLIRPISSNPSSAFLDISTKLVVT